MTGLDIEQKECNGFYFDNHLLKESFLVAKAEGLLKRKGCIWFLEGRIHMF